LDRFADVWEGRILEYVAPLSPVDYTGLKGEESPPSPNATDS